MYGRTVSCNRNASTMPRGKLIPDSPNARVPDSGYCNSAKRWSKGRVVLVVLLGTLGLLGTHPAVAQEDYIFCSRTGGEEYSIFDTYYYTAVFQGDYLDTLGYENDFYDFLKANQPDRFYVNSHCFYEETRADAEADLRRRQRADELNGNRVIRTNWSPVAVGGGADAFTTRNIRDFRISVPASPYDVRVCVRDHECEDGDRVRVSVNANELLGGEITNDWQCETVILHEGRHDIELYAINGTGFKGNCSYIDENTGELRVTGNDSQTQSWRHRGGKGSKANIVVTVQ